MKYVYFGGRKTGVFRKIGDFFSGKKKNRGVLKIILRIQGPRGAGGWATLGRCKGGGGRGRGVAPPRGPPPTPPGKMSAPSGNLPQAGAPRRQLFGGKAAPPQPQKRQGRFVVPWGAGALPAGAGEGGRGANGISKKKKNWKPRALPSGNKLLPVPFPDPHWPGPPIYFVFGTGDKKWGKIWGGFWGGGVKQGPGGRGPFPRPPGLRK